MENRLFWLHHSVLNFIDDFSLILIWLALWISAAIGWRFCVKCTVYLPKPQRNPWYRLSSFPPFQKCTLAPIPFCSFLLFFASCALISAQTVTNLLLHYSLHCNKHFGIKFITSLVFLYFVILKEWNSQKFQFVTFVPCSWIQFPLLLFYTFDSYIIILVAMYLIYWYKYFCSTVSISRWKSKRVCNFRCWLAKVSVIFPCTASQWGPLLANKGE